jgi:hypothetical protein
MKNAPVRLVYCRNESMDSLATELENCPSRANGETWQLQTRPARFPKNWQVYYTTRSIPGMAETAVSDTMQEAIFSSPCQWQNGSAAAAGAVRTAFASTKFRCFAGFIC